MIESLLPTQGDQAILLLEDDTILLERLRLAIKTQKAAAVLFSTAFNVLYTLAKEINIMVPGFCVEYYLLILRGTSSISELVDRALSCLR